jgi:hypothetical protein
MNDEMKKTLQEMIRDFYPFAKKEMGFNKPVRIFLTRDMQNAQDPLGKTAYYDPGNMEIKLFYVDRHLKDVVRSLAHELMHHKQNCEGRLSPSVGEGPVDENSELSKLEEEANMAGFFVRRWEEKRKKWPNAYYDYNLAKAENEEINKSLKLQEKKKKKAKLKKKPNPWAVCTAQVGRKNKKKYEDCVLSVKEKHGIKKESLQESKVSNNSDLNRSLDDTTERDTVKDHFSKRAERVFEKLTEKWKTKKESEVKTND